MPIEYLAETRMFHLASTEMSYLFRVLPTGQLEHVYWGRRVRGLNQVLSSGFVRAFSAVPHPEHPDLSFDTLLQECPTFGTSDMRQPICHVKTASGTTVIAPVYQAHRIYEGKLILQGLPATYAEEAEEAVSLEIDMLDEVSGLLMTLQYAVYQNRNVLTRSVLYRNQGTTAFSLQHALSASLDFPSAEFDMVQLSGSWARERHPVRRPVTSGTQSVESRRGASSHQQNPFIALLDTGATQTAGDVYGFSLVYSGNFLASVEVDQFSTTRVSIGINPFDFSWYLEPGEEFQTPEVVMVYSAHGLDSMSHTFHDLYRSRLARGTHRDQARPILLNNWEATYFDFHERDILELAEIAAPLGVELFVLDDGWFGERQDDTTSLGDWHVNPEKIPSGLAALASRINDLGMKFGLWFEPEMVSRKSHLFEQHPDWCLQVAGHSSSESRNQLVLDLSREDVCDWMIDTVSRVLQSAHIEYVKWDMNRHMTEVGSTSLPPHRARETAHRYMLGLYRVLDTLTHRFPHVLFESCSGGGGRFDAGMLYYMPQTWTSDNTDAISRLPIQRGTNLVYPSVSMGAHVSIVPNHQVGRVTPMKTRAHVAMAGTFGYELDVRKLDDESRTQMAEQVTRYKRIRDTVQFGDYYALTDFEDTQHAAWMHVAKSGQAAIVTFVQTLAVPNAPRARLKLRGLDAFASYEVESEDGTRVVMGGDELMYRGISLPYIYGDFQSAQYLIQRVT